AETAGAYLLGRSCSERRSVRPGGQGQGEFASRSRCRANNGTTQLRAKRLFACSTASAGECEEKTARCGGTLLHWTFLQGSKTAGRSKKSADGRVGRWFVIAIRRCCPSHSG